MPAKCVRVSLQADARAAPHTKAFLAKTGYTRDMRAKQTKNILRTKTESSTYRHTYRSKTEACTGWVPRCIQPQPDKQLQTQRAQTAVSAQQKSGLRGGSDTQQLQTQGCETEVCAGAGTWGIPVASSNLEEAACLASLRSSRKSGEPLQPKTSPPSRPSPPPLER